MKQLSIASYLCSNFIYRDLSNIFLLLTLFFCIYDYKRLIVTLKEYYLCAFYVMLFSLWFFVTGYYHNSSPLHELDNYFRFMFLFPILLLSLNDKQYILIIILCAFAGTLNAAYYYFFSELTRFQGTSSNAITYANLCAVMFVYNFYFIIFKKNKSYLLYITLIIFLSLYVLTGVRGPAIGIIFTLLYIFFIHMNSNWDTKKLLKISILTILTSIILFFIPNPVSYEFKKLSEINLINPLSIENKSLRERIYYINYGINELTINPILGIGPHNVEKRMKLTLNNNQIKNITPRDHLHNEFLDISVKFGIPALILLFLIYFVLYKSSDKDNRVMMNLILIMLMSSQLTQSQFAHHQAITFFIVLLFLNARPNLMRKHNRDNFLSSSSK